MKVELDVTLNAHQNAVTYFDKAKKFESKMTKITEVVALTQQKIDSLVEVSPDAEEVVGFSEESIKDKWYHKFRWFKTSSGLLAVGGRDAQSNEVVIKKHVEPTDLIFHTELPGSPFFVIQTKGAKIVDPLSLEEVAQMVAVYSRAWKAGYASTTVFWVTPDQVSKEANAGESMGTGAFMIRGKKNFIQPKVEISIGLSEEGVVVGTSRSLKKQGVKSVRIVQGREKPSSMAKVLRKHFKGGELDTYVKMLPAGGCRIGK